MTAITNWHLPRPSSRRAATYWNIEGPGAAPNSTYTQWGRDQATTYWKTYTEFGLPSGTAINNLFGSITTTVAGWTTGNVTNNRDVARGFLSELAVLAGSGMRVGLYAAQTNGFGSKLQATSWDLTVPIVVWIASWVDPIPSPTTLQNEYCPMPSIAGYFPMIWQYYGSSNEDYDISPFDGFEVNGYWEPTLSPGICG